MAWKLIPSEADECSVWIDWTRLVYFRGQPLSERVVMIPNQRTKKSVQTAILTRLGMRAGFPDYMVLARDHNFAGLFLEAKRVGGRSSAEQLVWREHLLDWGYVAHICEGARELVAATRAYFACFRPGDFVDRTDLIDINQQVRLPQQRSSFP